MGAGGYNEQKFKERIKEIQENDRAYWFGIGDMGDFIFYSDPRFTINAWTTLTMDDMRNVMQKHISKIVDVLEPIRDKCLGYGAGNHEEKAAKYYHTDPTIEVANRLKVKYMGYSALATLIFRKPKTPNGKKDRAYTLRVYMHHGFGGGRTHGAQINKVEQMVMAYEADIYAMGHVHGKVASKTNRIHTDQTGRPVKKTKAFLVTSSYQNVAVPGATTYAERMGFRESELMAPTVKFRFAHKRQLLDLEVVV